MAKKSELEMGSFLLSFQVFTIIEKIASALDIDFGLTLIFTIGSFIRKSGLINNSGLYIFFQQYRKKKLGKSFLLCHFVERWG